MQVVNAKWHAMQSDSGFRAKADTVYVERTDVTTGQNSYEPGRPGAFYLYV